MLLRALLIAISLGLAPAVAAQELLQVAVISDINGRYGSTGYHPRVAQAMAQIVALGPDLVIATGDLVAGQRPTPRLTGPELRAMWQAFDAVVREPLRVAGIPLLLTPGNHDASAFEEYSLERDTFLQHNRGAPPLPLLPGSRYPLHYAAALGGVLFLSLDATVPGALPQQQHAWLRSLLADAGGYRAVIAFGHLPLQPVTRGRERDILRDPALETLLQQLGVSAYLSGHHHAWYPGYRRGMAMLSMGNLGGNQRQLVGTSQSTGFSFSLLEIDPAGALGIRAFAAPDYRIELFADTLPAGLGEGEQRLLRLDRAISR